MKKAAEEIERRLHLLSGLMFAGHGLGMWCFGKEQELFYSTSPYAQELEMFLQISGILGKVTSEGPEAAMPMVYTDELELIWVGERVNLRDGGCYFILCGPIFTRKNTRDSILEKLDEMNLSIALRMKYSRILGDISVLDTDALRAVFRQIHFAIYDEYLPGDYFRIMTVHPEGQTDESSVHKTPTDDQISGSFDQSAGRNVDETEYAQMKQNETDLLNCVRTGEHRESENTAQESISNPNGNGDHSYGSFVDFGLSDELRSLKDSMIIFINKCSDAAVEGGLPIVTAKAMQSEGIHNVELCQTIGDVANANWQTFLGFVSAVKKAKENTQSGISLPVQMTMDYIRRNYNKPFTLEELASEAGYSEYYLSRKFAKETGVKVQDYIRDVRMEMAKVMLVSTKLSIYEIAEQLQYKSRSHFDRVFSQTVGVSPAQYRSGATKDIKV